ncbi:MAG: hypothetical protein SPJ27_03100 [Candidatus Onthovivens sp.]|nr:hypothetical protein [Candidatus Onthovivens sp.]
MSNKDLIEFYEEEQRKIQREIEDLWEVGKKSPKRVKRLVEIEYILNGLNADEENMRLRKENADLRKRLKQEGIEVE